MPIAYLQSQNSNLTDNGAGDLSPLLKDLEIDDGRGHQTTSLGWADEAIGCKPEAINLWIGTEKSRTSMHRDHYENLFTVIRGAKIFTLYPPSEAYFLCEGKSLLIFQVTTRC
jgi:jumonji domain-containing protein 7